MNELETILYSCILQDKRFSFYNEFSEYIDQKRNWIESTHILRDYTNLQIMNAAVSLEKKGLITIQESRLGFVDVSECHPLTPHEIVERKCKK